MLYERSKEIEERLDALVRLIRTGRYSTPALAAALSTSIPTVSRGIGALRCRGYSIRAVREANRWYYAIDTVGLDCKDSIRSESHAGEQRLGP